MFENLFFQIKIFKNNVKNVGKAYVFSFPVQVVRTWHFGNTFFRVKYIYINHEQQKETTPMYAHGVGESPIGKSPPTNQEMAPNRLVTQSHYQIRIHRWICDTGKSIFMYNSSLFVIRYYNHK